MSQLPVFSNSPVKTSNVIGTEVVNSNGDSLGDIKEVVIDPRSGKVAYVVMSFGGFLGMGTKLFAVPFTAFDYNVTEKEYVLNVSKEQLKDAPGFDPDHWPSMADEKWNRDVYTGGQPPDKLPSFGEDTPIGRPGQPAELAATYVLLASAESSYATGQVYGAVGGRGGP